MDTMIHILQFIILLGCFSQGVHTQITVKSSFSCDNRPSGYYADMETGCQVYHMCDGLGRQFSYSCPNTTLFQQRMLICDHWYMVNCSKSEDDYRANLLIGQKDKPFVADSEDDRYIRTPRPDLLTEDNIPAYNVIYRNGRAQSNAFTLNVIPQSEGKKNPSSTHRPFSSLPQRWFTTVSPIAENEVSRFEQNKPNESKLQNKFNNAKEALNQNGGTITFRPPVFNSKPETNDFSEFHNSFKKIVPDQQSSTNRRIDEASNPTNYFITDNDAIKAKTFPPNPTPTHKSVEELREFYLIPNFQFPLQSVSRPSYDDQKSSFDTIPNLSEEK